MGLESFSTDNSSDDVQEIEDEPTGVQWLDDFPSSEWNDMSADEKVEYVRENYMEDYRPEIIPGNDWSWSDASQIRCACGSTFFIQGEGECDDCGIKYSEVGRTVIMLG